MSIPSPKPNDSTDYSGVPAPSPTEAGTLGTAGWNDPDGEFTFPSSYAAEILQGVPCCVRVQLSGSGIVKMGPGQYAVNLSLSGPNTLQLTPNGADALQNETQPTSPLNVFTFWYTTRNANVATVGSDGIVTGVGRGQCEILVTSPRQINASFAGASPSGTEGVQASLLVTVVA